MIRGRPFVLFVLRYRILSMEFRLKMIEALYIVFPGDRFAGLYLVNWFKCLLIRLSVYWQDVDLWL